MISAGHLAFNDPLCRLKLRFMACGNARRMLASVDDLHVVDRDDRQPVVLAEEIAPALEIGDHHVRLE